MGMPSMPELLVILAIVVLLFGAKKIPDLAKGLGSGIKNFKKAMKEDEEESVQATAHSAKSEKIEDATKSEHTSAATQETSKQA